MFGMQLPFSYFLPDSSEKIDSDDSNFTQEDTVSQVAEYGLCSDLGSHVCATRV